MIVWNGRLEAARRFGWPASSVKQFPRFCSATPVPGAERAQRRLELVAVVEARAAVDGGQLVLGLGARPGRATALPLGVVGLLAGVERPVDLEVHAAQVDQHGAAAGGAAAELQLAAFERDAHVAQPARPVYLDAEAAT